MTVTKDKNDSKTIWLLLKLPAVLLILPTATQFWDKYISPIPNLHNWIVSNMKYTRYTSLSILIISILLIATYFLLLSWIKGKFYNKCQAISKKYQPAFGVLWDDDLNPYCPSCETLLSSVPNSPKSNLTCMKCKHTIALRAFDGPEITIGKAREMLGKGYISLKAFENNINNQ